jgi:imidazolonepropionase-like amidohydrolase
LPHSQALILILNYAGVSGLLCYFINLRQVSHKKSTEIHEIQEERIMKKILFTLLPDRSRKNSIVLQAVGLVSPLVVVFALSLPIQNEVIAETIKPIKSKNCYLFVADRVFDGFDLHHNAAVLINRNRVIQIGEYEQLAGQCKKEIDLGDATILPGFIESHAHVSFQNVPRDTVLKHGITTVRDTGGPLHKPMGGNGLLRLLSSGPIIQAHGGYPLNIFGQGHGAEHGTDGTQSHEKYGGIGLPVATVAEAEQAVEDLVAGGAVIIKVALEPGGEEGAPWMSSHGHGEIPPTPWPLLSPEILQAIVNKAHALNKRVLAHVGENTGVEMVLNAGVDEWAHMPCALIREDLLHRAVMQGVVFVTTVDTLSSCAGVHANMHVLAHIMTHAEQTNAKFIYGSEIGHDNVPWGINGEEMRWMLMLTSGEQIEFADVLNVFKAVTSDAGKNLGIPHLGTLMPDALADMVAVRGNPFERFKLLEYPDLVVSGGHIVVNNFASDDRSIGK